MEIDLKIAQGILDYFGGEDARVSVEYWKEGHSGEGYYVYSTEYPEDGAVYLGMTEGQEMLAKYRDSRGGQSA